MTLPLYWALPRYQAKSGAFSYIPRLKSPRQSEFLALFYRRKGGSVSSFFQGHGVWFETDLTPSPCSYPAVWSSPAPSLPFSTPSGARDPGALEQMLCHSGLSSGNGHCMCQAKESWAQGQLAGHCIMHSSRGMTVEFKSGGQVVLWPEVHTRTPPLYLFFSFQVS